jgi:hypothetical protein
VWQRGGWIEQPVEVARAADRGRTIADHRGVPRACVVVAGVRGESVARRSGVIVAAEARRGQRREREGRRSGEQLAARPFSHG